MTQQDVTPASLPKPGAFAKGGKGWQIMGIIGDALQAAGGGRPTYAPAMMERQQLETEGRQRLQQLMAHREIGSASGGERVYEYVLISLCAATIKTKHSKN